MYEDGCKSVAGSVTRVSASGPTSFATISNKGCVKGQRPSCKAPRSTRQPHRRSAVASPPPLLSLLMGTETHAPPSHLERHGPCRHHPLDAPEHCQGTCSQCTCPHAHAHGRRCHLGQQSTEVLGGAVSRLELLRARVRLGCSCMVSSTGNLASKLCFSASCSSPIPCRVASSAFQLMIWHQSCASLLQ